MAGPQRRRREHDRLRQAAHGPLEQGRQAEYAVEQKKVTPNLETLLEDLGNRGDRQRLFVAKVEFVAKHFGGRGRKPPILAVSDSIKHQGAHAPARLTRSPMSKETDLRRVLDCGIVAVVRSPDSQQLVEVARALADGGVTVVEITMTVPDALDVLRQVRRALGDRILLGAGTILDPETARAALLAGAEYLVAPTLNLDVIRLCQRYDKLVMPGAFTPTEILTAWEAGADIVKVFPADVVGPAFFKAMRGPLPQVRLMPTGGVDLNTAADFLQAGACCLGVGGQLVEPKAVADGQLRPHPRPGPPVRRRDRR